MTDSRTSSRAALQAALLGYIALFLLAGASLMVDTSQAHSWAEQHLPFFWALFAFAGALLIIGVTHILGMLGLRREKDPYSCSACHEEEQ